MRNVILYHGDCVDGFTAAWAARLFLGPANCTALPVRYGEPMPAMAHDPEQEIWIVDFSYPRQELEALAGVWKVRVIDHHKTAQADLAGIHYATFDMERSGAGLVWDWFNKDCPEALVNNRALPRPWIIDYVEDRDLWRFSLPNSREVNAFLRSQIQDFDRWDMIAGTDAVEGMTLKEAAEQGRGCLAHIDAYVRAALKHAYWARLGDLVLPMVNVTYESCSEVADAMVSNFATDCAGYYFERGDGKFQYGLRSRSGFDCSVVSKAFGGGGHAGASGFVVDRIVHERNKW